MDRLISEKEVLNVINRYGTDELRIKAIKAIPSAEPKYCDHNICLKNEYNGIGCDECEVTKSQEPCEDIANCDFQIGDEVRIIGSDPIYDDCDVGWVIRNASERVKTMYVMRNDGSAGEEIKAEWYKTGRHNDMLAEVINALPSVKPQEKTGHWILLDECSNSGYYCSECHKKVVKEGWSNTVKKIKYCPNCGCRMIKPQKSEDK